MLMTGPSGWPSALAYCPALVCASATALARAAASSPLSSVRLREISLIVVALPPAWAASSIWLPATLRFLSVAVSDSLTP
jgi:hypothetical protein